jgi:hypothetical protein
MFAAMKVSRESDSHSECKSLRVWATDKPLRKYLLIGVEPMMIIYLMVKLSQKH